MSLKVMWRARVCVPFFFVQCSQFCHFRLDKASQGVERNCAKGQAMIQFKEDVCANLDTALQREWLETNGLGGFASSTILGLNTRRYHSLLTAATKPPVGRLVLLAKLEETLILDGQRFELSANQYLGVVHPQGYRYLTHFPLEPFPVWTY